MNDAMMHAHLLEVLDGGAAHIRFEAATAGFPVDRAGEIHPPLEHSMWMLVEHLRLVNRDLIDWVIAEDYHQKPYPSGYWPSPEPPDPAAWETSVAEVEADLRLMRSWITDEAFDISAPLSRHADHSAAREILLAVAHNGYHIGQMVDLRALLGVPVKDW